jgi:hypothetical protein
MFMISALFCAVYGETAAWSGDHPPESGKKIYRRRLWTTDFSAEFRPSRVAIHTCPFCNTEHIYDNYHKIPYNLNKNYDMP